MKYRIYVLVPYWGFLYLILVAMILTKQFSFVLVPYWEFLYLINVIEWITGQHTSSRPLLGVLISNRKVDVFMVHSKCSRPLLGVLISNRRQEKQKRTL